MGLLPAVASGQATVQPPTIQFTPRSNLISDVARIGDAVMFDSDADGPLPARLTIVGGLGGPYSAAGVSSPPHYIKQFDGQDWVDLPSASEFVAQSWMSAVMDPDGSGPLPETLVTFGTFCEPGVSPMASPVQNYRQVRWSGLAAYVGRQWVPVPGSEATVSNAPALTNLAFNAGTINEVLPSRAVVIDFDGSGMQPPMLACLARLNGETSGIYLWTTEAWQRIANLSANSFNHGNFALTVHDADAEGPTPPVLISTIGLLDASGSVTPGAQRYDGAQWKPVSQENLQVWAVASLPIDPSRPTKRSLVARARPSSAALDRLVVLNGERWQILSEFSGFSSSGPSASLMLADPDGDGPRGVGLVEIDQSSVRWFQPPAAPSASWTTGRFTALYGPSMSKSRSFAYDPDGSGPRPPEPVTVTLVDQSQFIGSQFGINAYRRAGSRMDVMSSVYERLSSLPVLLPFNSAPAAEPLGSWLVTGNSPSPQQTLLSNLVFVPYVGPLSLGRHPLAGTLPALANLATPFQLSTTNVREFGFDIDGPGPREAQTYRWFPRQDRRLSSTNTFEPRLPPSLWRWNGTAWNRVPLPTLRPQTAFLRADYPRQVPTAICVAVIDAATGRIATSATPRPTLALAGDFDFADGQPVGPILFYTPGTREVNITSVLPERVTTTRGMPFVLSASASGSGPISTRWVSVPPLPSDAVTSGSTLSVSSMLSGTYELTFEATPEPVFAGAPSETVSSITVVVTVPPCGVADVAGPNQAAGRDNRLTADDVIVYIGRYFAPVGSAQRTLADIAGLNQSPGSDGQVNADDLVYFLSEFFAGCD